MNTQPIEFTPFPKIKRFFREIIVTEKLDGTNTSIRIVKPEVGIENFSGYTAEVDGHLIYAGSGNRWITPDDDNFGFAAWVKQNASELLQLGSGTHFGEWWGLGIQRGYGLAEKRFSLFNTTRWCLHGYTPEKIETQDPRIEKYQDVLPPCVGLVPVLYRGRFDTDAIQAVIDLLDDWGSMAAPEFMNPEGIIIYHIAANVAFKYTLGNDGHKGT